MLEGAFDFAKTDGRIQTNKQLGQRIIALCRRARARANLVRWSFVGPFIGFVLVCSFGPLVSLHFSCSFWFGSVCEREREREASIKVKVKALASLLSLSPLSRAKRGCILLFNKMSNLRGCESCEKASKRGLKEAWPK